MRPRKLWWCSPSTIRSAPFRARHPRSSTPPSPPPARTPRPIRLLDHGAGLAEQALDVGRRAERRRIRRAVVERAEVLQAGRVERELFDGDDDQLRAAVARLDDRAIERAACGRAVVVADEDCVHR